MKPARFFATLLFVLIFSKVIGSPEKDFQRAYATYTAGEWLSAIEELKSIYDYTTYEEKYKEKKGEILFMIGDCYRRISDAKKTQLWLKKAIEKEYKDPIVFLYLADALKMTEEYKEAEEYYKKYKELVPGDIRGENGVESCKLAQKWTKSPNGYQVENMKFFNSRAEDFCPSFSRADYGELYFTSTRKGNLTPKESDITGQNPPDIFFSRLDRKDKWSDPVSIENIEINSIDEEGATCFNNNFSTMYFTSCKKVKNKPNGCKIYTTQFQGQGWATPKALEIAEDSVTIAHPAISPDELTLYFASDLPGGMGDMDIWKVSRASASEDWGAPENVGAPVNTAGKELYPYVHPDGTLYFSSNSHIGLGGLDIFKVVKDAAGQMKIENLRYPMNSAGDDFGIVFQAENEKGFFSSVRNNRTDADIYSFTLPPLRFTASGVVVDEKTSKPLESSTVRLISSDGSTAEFKTIGDGSFKFTLKPGTDYVFIGSHEGFLNGKQRESTKGVDKSKEFKVTISLASIAKPIELPNIFYDFGKWDLRPESMVALDKLVETLNDNPNITIELMSHTDSRGSEQANVELSQKRAQSVVNFLIEKGIATDRLTAKGYGKSKPKEVDEKIVKDFTFLKLGTILDENFINTLTLDEQEFANQINRRTEFRVLRTDYIPQK